MKLSNLASVLRSAGLTVVECAGWSNRGYAGQDLADVRGVLWHHTATNRQRFYDSDAPTLSMCVNGRSDLAGPLCNIVFGRNGTVYLVAAGVANHAGAGSAHTIPTNMGNHYLIGIEMESSGIAPWDWTADQLHVAPYLGAALERVYGATLQIAHYEYSSQGKIDPAGWPGGMDGLRASINAVLDAPSFNLASTGITTQSTTAQEEDDDMPSAKEVADEIFNRKFGRAEVGGETTLKAVVEWYDANRVADVKGVLEHPVPNGDTGKTTSLAEHLRWYGSGLDNVYRAVLTSNAQAAAMTEAVKALAAAGGPTAAGFDQEAFFERLQGVVDGSVEDGLERLRIVSVDGGNQ